MPLTSGTAKPIPKSAQSFTFKCYKCGEVGHKAIDCKKGGVHAQGKGKALMIEGCGEQEDEEFPMYEEEIVIGDSDEEEGLALVMKKTLLAPKQEQEDWLMSNIFRSTCNISGKIQMHPSEGGFMVPMKSSP